MDREGKASIPFALGGLIDVDPGPLMSNPLTFARAFESHKEADAEAKTLGWSVVDGNHRCPECAKRESDAKANREQEAYEKPRRGAYIDLE